MRVWIGSLASLSGLRIRRCPELQCTLQMQLDPKSWLWCRPATAAQIRPLVWELVYATGAAIKRRGGGRKKLPLELLIIPVPIPLLSHPVAHFSLILSKKSRGKPFLFFFGHPHSTQKFPGQGATPNPHHSSDPSHSNDNARSLTSRPLGNSGKPFKLIHLGHAGLWALSVTRRCPAHIEFHLIGQWVCTSTARKSSCEVQRDGESISDWRWGRRRWSLK